MACEEQPGSLGFDLVHHFAVAAIADDVLRDGSRIEHAVLKSGFALHAKQDAEIVASELEKPVGRQRGELGIAFAANVTGQRQVPGGCAIWKDRGGEDRAEDFESFDFWDEHPKTLARM